MSEVKKKKKKTSEVGAVAAHSRLAVKKNKCIKDEG